MTEPSDPIAYSDFDVSLTGAPGAYIVSVINSSQGEATGPLEIDPDSQEFERLLHGAELELTRSRRQRRSVTAGDAGAKLGGKLFDGLFGPDILSLWDGSCREAARNGMGLRLRLRIEPSELARLPWEFLYDSRTREFLGRSRHSPIVLAAASSSTLPSNFGAGGTSVRGAFGGAVHPRIWPTARSCSRNAA